MDKRPIDEANQILRDVQWGKRSHWAALNLIQKARIRNEAQTLREQVRTSA